MHIEIQNRIAIREVSIYLFLLISFTLIMRKRFVVQDFLIYYLLSSSISFTGYICLKLMCILVLTELLSVSDHLFL